MKPSVILTLLAASARALLLPTLNAATLTIDTSPAGRQQTMDGFGSCPAGTEAQQAWWQALYYDDLQASILRVDLTPRFKSPYNGQNGTYNSPWYHNNPSLPGPDDNNVRVYTNAELQKNVTDCEALAALGRYYAAKIRGACALVLFDATSEPHEQTAALRHLTDALAHWKTYAAIRDAHYVSALYNRLGFVDITALTEKAAADIEIARSWKPGTIKDDGKRGGTEKGFRK